MSVTCPHLSGCALYPKFKNEALLNVWKITYCESAKHVTCARFIKSGRGEVVPLTLLPNGKTLQFPDAPAGKPGP